MQGDCESHELIYTPHAFLLNWKLILKIMSSAVFSFQANFSWWVKHPCNYIIFFLVICMAVEKCLCVIRLISVSIQPFILLFCMKFAIKFRCSLCWSLKVICKCVVCSFFYLCHFLSWGARTRYEYRIWRSLSLIFQHNSDNWATKNLSFAKFRFDNVFIPITIVVTYD